jgi:hypothetical protein
LLFFARGGDLGLRLDFDGDRHDWFRFC